MQAIQPILLGLGLLFAGNDAVDPGLPDLAHLREKLQNRQHPHGQSQAALLLVQSRQADAEKVVRDGLRGVENVEVFLALAAAVRLHRDHRFLDELFKALSCDRPVIREAAGRTLAVLSDCHLVKRLRQLADDDGADAEARQTALWTLGRCGTKDAARVLLEHLRGENELRRRAAAAALHDLSGQDYGVDAGRWQAWWESHRTFSNERWLELRLAYQTSRAHRLEGDLTRARAQLLRLQQQLYSRLSASERVSHIQSLLDQDDPAVRALAVTWSVELLPTAELAHKRLLTQVLLRLSQDSTVEVRRAAVLGLGRVSDVRVFERLQRLAHAARSGETPIPPAVRTAALHALTLHARSNAADAPARRKQIMPLLQEALDDPALEVVVEAAEDLGTLGAREAGPVLTGLLHHPSETVRQAAAQALDRVAEPTVLPALFDALDDSCPTVRFNLVGALAHATGDGARLSEEQRKRLLARLEQLLQHDSDPGVRSRAATVLGECASAAQLATLWRCVLAGEDARVQEKAWTAFLDILTRTGQLLLVREWDRKLTAARQGPRRLQMLTEILTRWQRQPPRKDLLVPAQEMLVQAQLELGKWSAAFPLLRDLLTRPASEAELNRRLGWLLTAGEQALHEGKRAEAQRAVETAQPFLPPSGKLTTAFEKLRQKAAAR
ncbi:MAG TPA: HEAT repeat domain-containing protein [Gemmataceae bacterium]|nr:HEAT repeat domain-containing protein [Gemmataceae bacterium]